MHLFSFLLIQWEISMTIYSSYKSIINDYSIKLEIYSNIHFIYSTVFKISLFSDWNGIFQKPLSSTTLIIIRHFSWAANQHIWMISGGSFDTEDWSNNAEKFSFASQENICKYIQIENCYFKFEHFTKLQLLLCFEFNKCCLCEHEERDV